MGINDGEALAADAWVSVVQHAAIAGVDPWPLTLRELLEASKIRQTVDWDHTCDLICTMANLWSSEQLVPAKIHPLREYVPPKSSDPSVIYNRLTRGNGGANGRARPGQN